MRTYAFINLLMTVWFISDSIHEIRAFSRPLQHNAVDPRVKSSAFSPSSVMGAPTTLRSSPLCLFRGLRNRFSNDVVMERSSSFSFMHALKRRLLWSKLKRCFRIRTLKQWLLACTIFLAASTAPAMARSGGRIGGTYSRPMAPSMSRPARPTIRRLPSSHHHPGPTRTRYHRPAPIYRAPIGYSTTTVVQSPFVRELHPRQVTASDLVLWAGTGLAVTYGVRNHYKNHVEDINNHRVSALGPGASVASITVALQVPDRSDSTSILNILDQKAHSADTSTRRGLQYVVSETALELLRKESSIISVGTSIRHYRTVKQAQVSFQQASVLKRSKLDHESVSNVGGSKFSRDAKSTDGYSAKATMAVVSLSICIEGIRIFNNVKKTIRNRKDLRRALSRIASDSQAEDCLLSAEILWTPEEPNEVLSEKDVYAEYPDLYPLID